MYTDSSAPRKAVTSRRIFCIKLRGGNIAGRGMMEMSTAMGKRGVDRRWRTNERGKKDTSLCRWRWLQLKPYPPLGVDNESGTVPSQLRAAFGAYGHSATARVWLGARLVHITHHKMYRFAMEYNFSARICGVEAARPLKYSRTYQHMRCSHWVQGD